jgi:hypothetical protein
VLLSMVACIYFCSEYNHTLKKREIHHPRQNNIAMSWKHNNNYYNGWDVKVGNLHLSQFFVSPLHVHSTTLDNNNQRTTFHFVSPTRYHCCIAIFVAQQQDLFPSLLPYNHSLLRISTWCRYCVLFTELLIPKLTALAWSVSNVL